MMTTCRLIAAAVQLLLLIVIINNSSATASNRSFNNLSDRLFMEIGKEKFKRKFLDALGLKQAPKFTGNPNVLFDSLPDHIKRQVDEANKKARRAGSDDDNDDDEKSITERVIVRARQIWTNLSHAGNFHFSVKILNDLTAEKIISAKVYGERDKNSVTEVNLELWETKRRGFVIKFVDAKIQTLRVNNYNDANNEIVFEFTNALTNWMIKRRYCRPRPENTGVFTFAIVCLNCAQYGVDVPIILNKTMVEIKYKPTDLNRAKRSLPPIVYCRRQRIHDCCSQSLTISFADIGWSDWILYPNSVTASFCYGRCLRGSHNTYTEMIQAYRRVSFGNDTIPVKVCCSPTSYTDFKLIALDENGGYYMKTIPNILVSKCGCV